MRFYFYSSELLTYVEAKWAKTTIAAGGILVGTMLFFGVLEPNQSVVNFRESRSTRALATENEMLRRQIAADSVLRLTRVTNRRTLQSMVQATADFRH